jgi:hypothetical protein
MNKFIKSRSLPTFLIEQAPTLGISMIIAEFFYNFHSFILECITFLFTWYLLDVGREFLSVSISKKKWCQESGTDS